ncbi:hypothetical protein [Sandaracinus amylolyticus]|uniref:hypothetical protein n=1 Tax=Sandaracinus amylolyticus TaxID=927083 RepID=UPI001F2E1527|nr:hypothetical protein [Sandaracinus amylolyticus]UJR81242.1 Hypothetical protein I5071_32980 [Sandaracinus amylolyticus]
MTKNIALALLLFASLGGCQCGGEREPEETTSESEPSTGAYGDTPTGIVEGIVRLAEGTELPTYPQNPLVVPGRTAIPDDCTPPREVDRTPVVVAGETGGLVGLSIVGTGTDDDRWPTRPPVTHEITIRDCRIQPSLVVTTRGDQVRLSNDTDYPFFPELGEGVLQALLRAEPRMITLDQGGVRTIQCGFAAPCGRMELITLYHPVHTVSQPNGRFRLEIPSGQDVRITAWHPLFHEAHVTARVEPGETRQVELTIRPAPMVAPPTEPRGEPADVNPQPNVPF